MAKTKEKEVEKNPDAIDKDEEKEILTAIYQKIGGKPADYYKHRITRVHQDSFRVNIYTCSPESAGEYVKDIKMPHSFFYILPSK